MRWFIASCVVTVLGVVVLAADDKPLALALKKDDAGKLPAGWKAAKTGEGDGSVWKVVADDTTPSKSGLALAQTAEGPKAMFNVCIADDRAFTNVELRVAFKAVSGKIDQGGGVVWRYQDPNNYYVCRYNPLESNFRVYKVEGGKRTQFEHAGDIKVEPGTWHTVKVRHLGKKIVCFLDDKMLLQTEDETFPKAGKVGLWTKADAVTHFDGFSAQEESK
jgi:hypothetical protein